ncbi:hypothetical protein [Pseudomonas cichorii]|uniref:hypothetical protein n=1 Tax=Pseudomonas cichorii TaxID=36746 RepID=UPI000EFDC05D|nr:hypothetical protein [Pseudomonas cichorii]
MNRRIFVVSLGMAGTLVIALLGFYWATFGFNRSTDQAVWGSFGDYFAGILNPIFSLFAFMTVLWSLHLQMNQLREISAEKLAEEILQVIKDIDGRIISLISLGSKEFPLQQMIFEAERNPEKSNRTEEYSRLLRRAKEQGSEIETTTSNLCELLISMHRFAQRHPKTQGGAIAPLVEYYLNKTSSLIHILEATTSIPADVVEFFKTRRI